MGWGGVGGGGGLVLGKYDPFTVSSVSFLEVPVLSSKLLRCATAEETQESLPHKT